MEWYNIAQEGQGTDTERKRGSRAAHNQSQSWRWMETIRQKLAAGVCLEKFMIYSGISIIDPNWVAALSVGLLCRAPFMQLLPKALLLIKNNQSGITIKPIFLELHNEFFASIFLLTGTTQMLRNPAAADKSTAHCKFLNLGSFLYGFYNRLLYCPRSNSNIEPQFSLLPDKQSYLDFAQMKKSH